MPHQAVDRKLLLLPSLYPVQALCLITEAAVLSSSEDSPQLLPSLSSWSSLTIATPWQLSQSLKPQLK